jgi:hypothetical protein
MEDRYPYLLTGLVSCKKCGDRMVGKTAHGKTAHGKTTKVPYYEHAFNTITGANIPGLEKTCSPSRVSAKNLDSALWNEVTTLLSNEAFAKELLEDAKRAHKLNPGSKEIERHNQEVYSADRQLEMMAERLASLPATISPTPVYKQMEKLEEKKKQAQERLKKLQASGAFKDEPVPLQDYLRFLKAVGELMKNEEDVKFRSKVVRLLVDKLLIIPEGFEVYLRVGEGYTKVFLAKYDELKTQDKRGRGGSLGPLKFELKTKRGNTGVAFGDASHFLGFFSSHTSEI